MRPAGNSRRVLRLLLILKAVAIFLVEFFDPARSINNFLFASIKGVAGRAHLDV
ncbi:hypothetical protein NSMM_90011 [Nitrosomonas mobilis]|uniref:Uncharacterized protein n=1 Tax=Nitrosomonas mobilis TaxID=51642 RepID=A0A1G5SIN4_9PROT|nr:hypothetical protein NSMM_90011 [Nitrosomonas mobilis]